MSNEIKPIDEVRQALHKNEKQFKMVLPAHIPTDRFVRVTMTAIQNKPELLKLDRASLYSACMAAAQQGLLPDGREGAIVPFGGAAKWMPMTAGILKMVRNSGELLSLNASVVYENDKFEYWTDENGEHLDHRPDFKGARGEPKLVYAVAKTKDGGVYVEIMSGEEIEKVRRSSKSGGSGPWKEWASEMWKKTVIRRLSKRLPMSTDLDTVVRAEETDMEFESTDYTVQEPAKKASSKLDAVVDSHLSKKSTQANPEPLRPDQGLESPI